MSEGSAPRPSDAKSVATAFDTRMWHEAGHLSLRKLGARVVADVPRLAPWLDVARRVRSLDISGNRLGRLPDWLWELANLEQLVVAANRLTSLDGIARFTLLRELDVSDNRLTQLPPELDACAELRRLDFSGNMVADIGPVAMLPLLVVVDMAHNRIRNIPDLAARETLQSLDASNNQVETLPPSFARLISLRRLDLSGNRLTSASTTVLYHLPLEELYLDDNLLDAPVDTAGLSMLRRLSDSHNLFGEAAEAQGEPASAAADVKEVLSAHVSGGAEPGKLYFDAPTYTLHMTLAVEARRDAQKVVDLYFKQFSGVAATIVASDGARVDLSNLSRRTALEFIDEHGGSVSVGLPPTKDAEALDRGNDFLSRAVSRIDRAALVPDVGAETARQFSQKELGQPPRVLNVALTDAHHRVLPIAETLAPEREYAVRINVSAIVNDTVVIDPVPISEEKLHASSTEGYWFDVVVVSSDIAVTSDVHRMFLPFAGPSWVCSCKGPEHSCEPGTRDPYLHVPIRTGARIGGTSLRCTIYNANNTVQSVRVDFVVGGDSGSIRGVVDFALSRDAGQAHLLPARQLNVLTNESPTGTHKIVVNNGERVIAVDVTEAEANTALSIIRAKLTEITLGTDSVTSKYDDENRKPKDPFLHDLRQLALLGSQLFTAVLPDRDDRRYLRERLADQARIQITRVSGAVFPWALIYDIPRELGIAEWTLCPLLEQGDTNQETLANYPTVCPNASAHRPNILCPYGFWGFRHFIEQPPSVRRGVLPTRILVADPARAATGVSLALDPDLKRTHFAELTACLGSRFDLDECDSRLTLHDAFADPQLPLVYFYCHGKTAQLGGTNMLVPFLEIGASDRIGASDLLAWDDEWGPDHWAVTAPLVFINGCNTAKLSPGDIVSFVNAFTGMHAAGVIGTEIPVAQRVAGEVAVRFYTQFAGDAKLSVGAALHRMRMDLLRKGNLAGLGYTSFCSMDLALEPTS